jgi:hypothetical protein
VLAGKIEPAAANADLGLDKHRFALGGRELHGLAEAGLAAMALAAIDIGMVEHRHAGLQRRIHEGANIGIAHRGDAHQAQHDAGNGEIGMGERIGFHGPGTSWIWAEPI